MTCDGENMRISLKLTNFLNKFKFLYLRLKSNQKYSKYLETQQKRSKEKYFTGSRELQKKRKDYLVDLLESKVELSKLENALVIGCRDCYELDLLEKKGIRNVIGIDLFSFDIRIKVMDMHEMKFEENMFDLIYCSHALEHAFDYKKVLQEIIRVLKRNGVLFIEVPVNYETTTADLHDYVNSDNLINLLSHFTNIDKIFVKCDIKKDMDLNFSGTDIARLFLQINKD
jgi:SAM-dependent methyltransferase